MNTINPESLGFSSARLARINAVMQRYVDEGKLAGIISLIARHGQIAHLGAVGLADIEAKRAMQPDALFRIYSMTKPITSVAVMMLVEEAKLRLNDPVAAYIPAFKDMRVLLKPDGPLNETAPANGPITLQHLLTHTAGLSYGFEQGPLEEEYRNQVLGVIERAPGVTLESIVNVLAKFPLAHQPGSTWRYSVATDVLGLLVQIASGQPFDVFLKQRIFEPLGMADTGFYVPQDKLARFTNNYGPAEGGGLQVIDSPLTGRYIDPPSCPLGGAGLVSTTGDYWRFTQMLLNKGELDGVRLLGRKSIELMATNHLPIGLFPFGDAGGFGLGFSVLTSLSQSRTLGSVGNYGWGGAANTNFWVDPQENLTGILMLQFMPSELYPVVEDFRNLTYQALVD